MLTASRASRVGTAINSGAVRTIRAIGVTGSRRTASIRSHAQLMTKSSTLARHGTASMRTTAYLQQPVRWFSDSHDDFKRKTKAQPKTPSEVKKIIEDDIKNNKVFLYMKGQPHRPQCGFSSRVCQILDKEGVVYGSRDVLEDNDIREGIKQFSNWPTVPQLYVNGEFIGGCDIVTNLYQTGELTKMLKDANAKQ